MDTPARTFGGSQEAMRVSELQEASVAALEASCRDAAVALESEAAQCIVSRDEASELSAQLAEVGAARRLAEDRCGFVQQDHLADDRLTQTKQLAALQEASRGNAESAFRVVGMRPIPHLAG